MRTNGDHWKSKHPNYRAVHAWLKYYHGKASKCEMPDCLSKSKAFNWALKKDCEYEKNIDNFMQLCSSCHKKYDLTEDTRRRLSESGKQNSCFVKDNPMNYESFRKKVSDSKTGLTIPADIRKKISDTQKGRKTSEEVKAKIKNALKSVKWQRARKVICTESGKSFDTIKEAASYVGLKYSTLVMMLRGSNKNKTTLKYA